MTTRKPICRVGWIVLSFLVIIGCSSDDDPVTPPPANDATATIGEAGGTLEIPGELVMTIPESALAADVDFEAKPNTSPPEGPIGFTLLSDVYSIEPSGTAFAEPVTLKLSYSVDDLGAASEDDIRIFTHNGNNWDFLGSTVAAPENEVTAMISHLSDFVVAVPTPPEPDPIYAQLVVHRQISIAPGTAKADDYLKVDQLYAAFSLPPQKKPNTPLQAESVAFGDWDLEWTANAYFYTDSETPDFLTLGSTYDFVVVASDEVPALDMPVEIMATDPYVTSLAPGQDVDLAGFTVDWAGASPSGTVDLQLRGQDNTRLDFTVPNNGSYTFTENDLSGIPTGAGSITLNTVGEMPIVADGYESTSRIRLTTSNVTDVVFTGETVIDEVTGVSTPNLAIPDAPGGPVTDIINIPATGVVDSVRVYLDISHQWMSDLVIKVTSPDGTQLRTLFIGEGGETDGRIQGWYPGDFVPKDDLNGFDGDTAGGNWTLTAQDYSADAAGVLNEWRLQIFYAQ